MRKTVVKATVVKVNMMERVSFKDATAEQRNTLALQYEPLVNKMVKQYFGKVQAGWDDLKSMAYEGLVQAMNSYDPERSKMTFTQFAAFAIRNNILNSLSEELRTVKMSSYMQEKAEKEGLPSFSSVSLTTICGETGGEDSYSREGRYGLYESAKFENGDVYEYMYMRLDAEFGERELDIFYSYFGLKGRKETPLQDLAKKYGVTSGRASQQLNKVIRFIRQDEDLREMLSSLIAA